MYKNIKFIHPEALIKALDDLKCGKLYAARISTKDFEIPQEEVKPLEGYEAPKDFPNCCEGHKEILKIATEYYNKFPDCCKKHRELLNDSWFNKNNYAYLPLKVVTTIAYTNHCIAKCIENPNWYKEITDYIEIVKSSYGQLPDGFGPPVANADDIDHCCPV